MSIELAIDTPKCRGRLLLYPGRELCPESLRYMASIGFTYVGHTERAAYSSRCWSAKQHTWHARLQLVDAQGCPKNRGTTGWKCEIQAYFISDEPRQLTGAEVPLGVDRVLL